VREHRRAGRAVVTGAVGEERVHVAAHAGAVVTGRARGGGIAVVTGREVRGDRVRALARVVIAGARDVTLILRGAVHAGAEVGAALAVDADVAAAARREIGRLRVGALTRVRAAHAGLLARAGRGALDAGAEIDAAVVGHGDARVLVAERGAAA